MVLEVMTEKKADISSNINSNSRKDYDWIFIGKSCIF